MTTEIPTIVSGIPRSGTSMMMQMVCAAGIQPLTDQQRSPDIENPRGYFEYEPVKTTRVDPSWLAHAGGKVVKMAHILIPDLPPETPCRIILMLRDLDEVLASQMTMLKRAGRPAPPVSEGALKRIFAAQMETTRRFIASRKDIELLEVDYNQVLAFPAEQANRIAEFLGRPSAAALIAAAVDEGLYRNRKV